MFVNPLRCRLLDIQEPQTISFFSAIEPRLGGFLQKVGDEDKSFLEELHPLYYTLSSPPKTLDLQPYS